MHELCGPNEPLHLRSWAHVHLAHGPLSITGRSLLDQHVF